MTSLEQARKSIIDASMPLWLLLDEIGMQGQITGSRRKLLYMQLRDALRTIKAVLALIDARERERDISADSVEVLVRRVVEQAIVGRYLALTGREAVLRYLKTSEAEFNRIFKESVDEGHGDVPQLPNYRQMSEGDPDLYEAYQRLSFTTHPRSAQSFDLQERESQIKGEDIDALFCRRVEHAVQHLSLSLSHLLTAYEQIDALGPYELDPNSDSDGS